MAIAQLFLLVLLVAPALDAIQKTAPTVDPLLVRVYVITDDGGVPDELADRQQSVKDLVNALGSKKKTLVVIEDEDAADVVLDVLGRGLNTPRIVIGLTGRPGQPRGPVRTAMLQIRFAQGDETALVANKNKPNATAGGWKSAAENIADQVEKLIAKRRAEILRARSG